VIRSPDDEPTPGAKDVRGAPYQLTRAVEMLNDITRYHCVEVAAERHRKPRIDVGINKLCMRAVILLRNCDPAVRRIDANDLTARRAKQSRQIAIAAAEIADDSNIW